MNRNEAKNLVNEYLKINLDEDVSILGEDHPYNDTTIGKIREAYHIISDWFDEYE